MRKTQIAGIVKDMKAVETAEALLAALPKKAGAKAEQTEDGLVVTLKDSSYAAMAFDLLANTYRCDYGKANPDRSMTITLDENIDWYPRTRRTAGELDPDKLVLALCVQQWVAPIANDPYKEVWRHVLECDDATGKADFGTGSDGGCETCYSEYPAVIWNVKCECGLLNLGGDPYDMTWRLGYGQSGMAWMLGAVENLREEYLAGDKRHTAWLPGISKTKPAKKAKKTPEKTRAGKTAKSSAPAAGA